MRWRGHDDAWESSFRRAVQFSGIRGFGRAAHAPAGGAPTSGRAATPEEPQVAAGDRMRGAQLRERSERSPPVGATTERLAIKAEGLRSTSAGRIAWRGGVSAAADARQGIQDTAPGTLERAAKRGEPRRDRNQQRKQYLVDRPGGARVDVRITCLPRQHSQ